jgi:chemotaxis protein MotB
MLKKVHSLIMVVASFMLFVSMSTKSPPKSEPGQTFTEKEYRILERELALADRHITEMEMIIEDLRQKNRELEVLSNTNADRTELAASLQKMSEDLESAHHKVVQMDMIIMELEERNIKQQKEAEEKMALLNFAYTELQQSCKDEIKDLKVDLQQLHNILTLTLAEELFFETGRVEIKPSGKVVLYRIGKILKQFPEKNIRVEGHTDDVPIGPMLRVKYQTNWDLGAKRAINVVRFLKEEVGIDPLRLSAVTFAQFRPIDTNRTSEGRIKNRRIEIILVDRNLDLAQKMRRNLISY